MDFRFYFLKEGTRVYEKNELITFLTSNANIAKQNNADSYGKNVYLYHHPVLNFEAKFVMADRSVVPHLENLSPKFFDVNFYVEFNVLLSNYAVEILLDIIEEIVKRFRFHVYNEAFNDVSVFRRAIMIRAFASWKKAYASQHPEAVSEYKFLDPQAFSQVYGYLQKRKRLELTVDKFKILVTNYIFLHAEKSRSAYVGIKWNGDKQFILPPAVDIMFFDDGKVARYLPMAEIMMRVEKMFRPIDGYGDILILDAKFIKKLHKILAKDRFAPLHVQLEPLSIDRILDI